MKITHRRKVDIEIVLRMVCDVSIVLIPTMVLLVLVSLWPDIMLHVFAGLIGFTILYYLFIRPSVTMFYTNYKALLREKIIKSKKQKVNGEDWESINTAL